MGVIIKALGRLWGQLHEMTYTMPLAELRAVIMIMYGSWCLAGTDRAKKEGTAIEDLVPFLGLGRLNWGGDGPLRKTWMGTRQAG